MAQNTQQIAPGGVDYSQYQTWQKVVAPSGQVYYAVPGTHFLYDPFISGMKGRPVLFVNPSQEVAAKKAAEDARNRQIALAEQAASPMGQAMPVAGGIAGAVAAPYILSKLDLTTTGEKVGQAAAQLAQTGQTLGQAGQTAQGAFTQGALNVPATPNVVNVGRVAEQVPAPGFFDLGGGLIEGQVTPLSGLGGALGAYGMYDILSNKKHGMGGALQGAASGAGIGTMIMPGIGTGIGAGLGALTGYFGNFGDTDAYKTEWKRKKDLFEQGKITAEQLGAEPMAGRSMEELIALENQRADPNMAFTTSRDEKLLRPQDISGHAAILEKANELNMDPMKLSELALASNAVREHHGTIDVKWDNVDLSKPTTTAVATEPVPVEQTRSNTVSPGIDKSGKPINYEMIGRTLAKRMDKRNKR